MYWYQKHNNNITICTAYEQQVTGMIAPNAFLFDIWEYHFLFTAFLFTPSLERP